VQVKRTRAAKLALYLRKKGKRPLLVAADVNPLPCGGDATRIAWVARSTSPVYSEENRRQADRHCDTSLGACHVKSTANYVLIDTAGRLQIDDTSTD
jgi:signal recognition particle subunit SRP54